MGRSLFKAAAVWLALALAPALALAETVHLRGSYIQIEAAGGFVESENFIGLEWPDAQATVFATEMPANAFTVVSARLKDDPNALSDENTILTSVTDVVIGGQPAVMARGRQQAGVQALEKWVLLVGAPQATMLLTGQMPSVTATPMRVRHMEQTLASIAIAEERRDLRDALPFTFAETERFRLGRVLSIYAVALTDSHVVEKPEERGLFVIGAGPGADCEAWAEVGQQAFAEKMIGALRSVRDLEPLKTEPATLGGDPGFQTETYGRVNGGRAIVEQTVRFRDCRYARTIGIAPAAEEALYRAEFARLAEGFTWRETEASTQQPTKD